MAVSTAVGTAVVGHLGAPTGLPGALCTWATGRGGRIGRSVRILSGEAT